ncbi:hypothetical protein T4B_5199 [Trichinella pseudospiralis]|uniref:Uncharacterized protein n=1 Tax=Trichinella pseudospiralis TaxID=6337 RepID=A0A0V1GCV3_TRIPS|nr:hypothetical protein T4B_5199 [Trichinella pseudospiralis]KRY96122.1 hypothetical protein T4C_5799 [Trichinella pseudospiralis]
MIPEKIEANLVPVQWKPCSSTSSGSGFQPLKFRFPMFIVWLCGPTTIWKFGKAICTKDHVSTTWDSVSFYN